jgi:hypothetical protein
MATEPMRQAKLVLLGDMGAGKSSLVIRFVKGQYFDHLVRLERVCMRGRGRTWRADMDGVAAWAVGDGVFFLRAFARPPFARCLSPPSRQGRTAGGGRGRPLSPRRVGDSCV